MYKNRERLLAFLVCFLTSAHLFYSSTNSLSIYSLQLYSVHPGPSEALLRTKRPRHRPVILLGPHDRYNFGDLLFGLVVSRLLQDRAGYYPEDLIYAGTIHVDMSSYGGPSNIIPMKEAQERSWNSTFVNANTSQIGGPFDIIYLGGEATGCNMECAKHMLPTPAQRVELVRNKVNECAYLFPKTLLVGNDNANHRSRQLQQHHDNFAIVNSLGYGYAGRHPACEEAVKTADVKGFRNFPPSTASMQVEPGDKLMPDSAVLIRELYQNEIDAEFEKSLQYHPGMESWKDNYIAVQHNALESSPEGSLLVEELLNFFGVHLDLTIRPSQILERPATHDNVTAPFNTTNITKSPGLLDKPDTKVQHMIALNSTPTIVFFAAGTVPNHDSFEWYEQVRQKMITTLEIEYGVDPALAGRKIVVWKREHALGVVGLIGHAKVVLSTSLHVRIMAFIYQKPRITWCTLDKHRDFITSWERNSFPCVANKKLQTWATLAPHLDQESWNNSIVQQDLQSYRRAVGMYMEWFDDWASFLNGTKTNKVREPNGNINGII